MKKELDKQAKDNIIQAIGVDGTDDAKEKVAQEVLDLILHKVSIKIIESLSGKETKELEKIARSNKANGDEKIFDYIKSKVSNLQELIENTAISTVTNLRDKLKE